MIYRKHCSSCKKLIEFEKVYYYHSKFPFYIEVKNDDELVSIKKDLFKLEQLLNTKYCPITPRCNKRSYFYFF